jgi:1-acyl-sn-glycerol-3-phosphate acyltransferase
MWYTVGMTVGRMYLGLTKQLIVIDTRHVPVVGPVILASNHKSNLDPFCIGAAVKRQVHFLAKDELFHNPVVGWYLRKSGSLPVRRGISDRRAIAASAEVLRQGRVLGVFVEGTRRRDIEGVGAMRAGAAMLSHRAKSPIVPVAIRREGQRIRVSFAPPIVAASVAGASEAPSRKAVYSRINEAIADALALMLRRSYAT